VLLVKAELKKLLDVGFIRLIDYPEWYLLVTKSTEGLPALMHRRIRPTDYGRLRELPPLHFWFCCTKGGIPIAKDITLTRTITQWFSFTITGRILSCVDQDLHDRSQGWQHSWTYCLVGMRACRGFLILLLQLTGGSDEMGGHNILDARQGVLAHNYWPRNRLVPIHWARSQLDIYSRWFATFTQVSGGWIWCLPYKYHPRKGI